MKPAATTIKVTHELKGRLDRLKVHPREPYNDVIARLIGERDGADLPARVTPRAPGSSSAVSHAVCYRLPDEQ